MTLSRQNLSVFSIYHTKCITVFDKYIYPSGRNRQSEGVFGIIIHRLIEIQNTTLLDNLLKDYGCLFKFHDRPISYLYNTLYYYENKLRDENSLKKSLISFIINSQSKNHPKDWASAELLDYIKDTTGNWSPSPQYFANLINRFVNTILNRSSPPFSSCDWRFNEFSNPSSHALYVTCVELMALPMSGEAVGKAIIDVICKGIQKTTDGFAKTDIMAWINATALILTSLPQSYLVTINKCVCDVMQNHLTQIALTTTSSLPSFFDFCSNYAMNCVSYADYILALFHATWLHANVGQFGQLYSFLKDNLKPMIESEAQFLYMLCLYGPFVQRFQSENQQHRCFFEICGEFYLILDQVCRNSSTPLIFVDVITDFLYHIKYMFVGDNLRNVIAQTMDNLHEPLQKKLKFMISPPAIATPTAPFAAPMMNVQQIKREPFQSNLFASPLSAGSSLAAQQQFLAAQQQVMK